MTLTEVQQKLRDRLDRISAYAHEHGALWENGDGTDDIIIAYAEHQATVIKRLQEANTNFACQACDQAQEIERLRAKVGKMEFLMRSTDDTCLACAIKLEVVDQQAARIKELEDALVEERANKMIQTEDCTQNPDSAEFHHRCICEYNVKKCPVEQWWLDRARVALQAEGKIGPDVDAKPHCWQITEERVDVLGFCLSGEFNRCGCAECDRAVAVLRAMLEEANRIKCRPKSINR